MVGGLALALAMNQHFRMKNLVRAVLLLPFIVPTVLSTVAWMWMLDPAFSVVNRLLGAWRASPPAARPGSATDPGDGLDHHDQHLARPAVLRRSRCSPDCRPCRPNFYEAATIDGAGGWTRFRYVTLPLLKPIILIVTMFSVIFTFADFQLVYVLTHGGPQNATNLFATYAFDIGMSGGQLGLGASVALDDAAGRWRS